MIPIVRERSGYFNPNLVRSVKVFFPLDIPSGRSQGLFKPGWEQIDPGLNFLFHFYATRGDFFHVFGHKRHSAAVEYNQIQRFMPRSISKDLVEAKSAKKILVNFQMAPLGSQHGDKKLDFLNFYHILMVFGRFYLLKL